MGYIIGVDIGGTFTDCVAAAPDGRLIQAKTLSTHATDPGDGILTGIGLLAEALNMSVGELLASTDRVSHGTTIGTNLVVERKGGPVGLITTMGHGDCMSMMRGNGRVAGLSFENVFHVQKTAKPRPLVPRTLVEEIHERIDAHGTVIVPLDEEGVHRAVRRLVEEKGIKALAIATLWSFLNPAHEQRIAKIAREVAPGLFISLSSEVSPRIGEYERTVATVINSYIGPASTRYLRRTDDRLREQKLAGPFLVMQANGGVIPTAAAEHLPVSTLDSGPAGGLAGTAALARHVGHQNVIATDMGGTSFDVGLVINGQPVISETCVLDQYTFMAPHLDCRSIACGGGSIARVDELTRSLRVGPHSAGSVPGPVAYGRGGTEPTVTDADVVLGLLRADGFLDGRMKLDAEAARAAMAALAAKLGIGVEEAAAGILRVNNTAAANLIRQRTIEQGLDPRDFVIYAFGGAGPVHAFGYAEELGVSEVVIPLGNGSSTLSAYGIASSDIVRYYDRSTDLVLPFDTTVVAAVFADLEKRAVADMTADGVAEKDILIERFGLMRYAEQFLQCLQLAMPDGVVDETWPERIEEDFAKEYARLYGEGALVALQIIEVFGLRVRATARLGRTYRPQLAAPVAAAKPGQRPVFWPGDMRWIETAVWDGRGLKLGDTIKGPAVVELPHTTVAVAPRQFLRLDDSGNMILSLASLEIRSQEAAP